MNEMNISIDADPADQPSVLICYQKGPVRTGWSMAMPTTIFTTARICKADIVLRPVSETDTERTVT